MRDFEVTTTPIFAAASFYQMLQDINADDGQQQQVCDVSGDLLSFVGSTVSKSFVFSFLMCFTVELIFLAAYRFLI